MFACGPSSEWDWFVVLIQLGPILLFCAPFLLSGVIMFVVTIMRERRERQLERLKALAAGYRFDD